MNATTRYGVSWAPYGMTICCVGVIHSSLLHTKSMTQNLLRRLVGRLPNMRSSVDYAVRMKLLPNCYHHQIWCKLGLLWNDLCCVGVIHSSLRILKA